MGAYETWLASVLTVYLETFARQHQLGRAVQAMLFDLTTDHQRLTWGKVRYPHLTT
jgi:hypothetical protein